MRIKLNNREIKAIRVIRNSILQSGEFPSIRELMVELGYKSPRSASDIIEKLKNKGALQKSQSGNYTLVFSGMEDQERVDTVDVPLLGEVACGLPMLAEENIKAFIPVSVKIIKPTHKYFFLRAKGDSMNMMDINDGDLVLIRQQHQVNDGDIVVALIDDEATIKEFVRKEDFIILKPRSTNEANQPIILTDDFIVQGVVVKSFTSL